MAGDLEGFSFEQRHGKDRVRVARVWRTGDGRHFMVEWDVSISLFSDIVGAYTRNDNSGIVATDTMKNTVYVKAKECSEQLSVEHFAILLAKHFTSFYKEVTAAAVKIVEKPWERVYVDGQPHEHGFKLGSEKHTTEVTVKKSGALELTSGIAGLSVLKTAMEPMSTGLYPSDPFILWVPKINDCDELSLVDSGPGKNFPFGWHQQSADASLIGQVFKCRAWSAPNASSVLGFDGPMRELHYLRAGGAKGALDPSGFEGFIRDKYTSLPETRERVLATEVTASWRYSYDTLSSIPRDLLYFQERYKDAKKVFLYTFFGPSKEGVYSASLESTLYQMARAVLVRFPDISAVQLKMPNLHFSPVNISTKDNPSMVKFNNDVYLPTDEPHGSIQASLSRFCSRM